MHHIHPCVCALVKDISGNSIEASGDTDFMLLPRMIILMLVKNLSSGILCHIYLSVHHPLVDTQLKMVLAELWEVFTSSLLAFSEVLFFFLHCQFVLHAL